MLLNTSHVESHTVCYALAVHSNIGRIAAVLSLESSHIEVVFSIIHQFPKQMKELPKIDVIFS